MKGQNFDTRVGGTGAVIRNLLGVNECYLGVVSQRVCQRGAVFGEDKMQDGNFQNQLLSSGEEALVVRADLLDATH